MRDKPNRITGQDSPGELYGVDGDGLGEGEVAYEGEISWPFSLLGVLVGVGNGFR